MSAGVVRAWDRGAVVAGRRLPAAYPIVIAAIALAVVVAACAGGTARRERITLENVPFQPLPEALTGAKLPIDKDGIIAIAERLPAQVAGQSRLPYGGWRAGSQFTAGWGDVAAWGAPNGLAGTPPIQIAIRHVESLGPQAAGSGAEAVIADANQAVNFAGRIEIGRDGQVVWSRRSDAGNTVALGRIDSPWFYVITAADERGLRAALLAFREAAGIHGGGHSTLR